jgi:L-ascorbate metabolism protein UlaG (beta-lactamase superfamily)
MKIIQKVLLAFLIYTFFSNCFLFRTIEKAPKKIEINPNPNSVQLFWIGHATVLLKLYDKWILTDPNFSESLGFVVKRYIHTPVETHELPELDIVLISHSHFDHFDKSTLSRLKIKNSIFVPLGAGTYIPSELSSQKVEMNRWESRESSGVKITAVPARHFGGRWLIDNLWDGDPYTGYIIQYKDKTIYFAGDTGYQKTEFQKK